MLFRGTQRRFGARDRQATVELGGFIQMNRSSKKDETGRKHFKLAMGIIKECEPKSMNDGRRSDEADLLLRRITCLAKIDKR